MAELKTKPNNLSVLNFLNTIPDEKRRRDGLELLKIFGSVTKEKPKMWGTSIVGFGQYHYKSERSSQEGDWPLTAFSPRKQNLSLYVVFEFEGSEDLLNKLGKYKRSVGCLYINNLSDVDKNVLEEFIKKSFDQSKKIHI